MKIKCSSKYNQIVISVECTNGQATTLIMMSRWRKKFYIKEKYQYLDLVLGRILCTVFKSEVSCQLWVNCQPMMYSENRPRRICLTK